MAKERIVVIKHMDFIIIATVVCIVFLITMPLLVAGCANPPSTPEEIDGGVRHYVDTDAPKTIESTQIVSFCCEFSTTNLEVDSSPVAGWYYTLYAGQDGGSYEARGGGEVYGERKFTPDAAFFNALQRIVSEYGFAQYNGQFYTVSGLPPDHGAKLDIQYTSGERIHAFDNQSCFLSLEAIEALVYLFYPNDSQFQEQK